MQWNSARCPLFIIAVFLILNPALVSGQPSLQGHFEDGIYTSPSGKFRCDLSAFNSSQDFFLNEAYDPDVSETMSFSAGSGNRLKIWLIRTQLEGRLDYLPNSNEGFPITRESFIPYYYSELPYGIESVKRWKEPNGQSEILRVSMDDDMQLHAYWVSEKDGWLNSIQFMPVLVGKEGQKLKIAQAKESLLSVHERCTFE